MCGIAGIYNQRTTAPVLAEDIERMLATIPYRGPDARGVRLYGDNVGLGHLRLAILDLKPESNQPFEIDDGNLVLTFNGEIFNYIELRAELEALGHRFRTQSDTEVLLRAYQQWGKAAVPRFNGMWAFAIYDKRRDVLFCARDRFGIKPFNYAVYGGRFLFGSEIKTILAVEPSLARPDYDSVSRILRAGVAERGESTCFADVKRLLPAHMMTVTRGGVQIERYWEWPSDMLWSISMDDAAEQLRELLIDSIKLRMRSDVPVGLTLSGGLDSSSLACLLRTFYDGPFETFTATYGGAPGDESPEAEKLAHSLDMNANLVPAQPTDFLDTLRRIIRHLESPSPSPCVFPLWNIMRLARTKVTAVLEGQGADELLAGYRVNFSEAIFDRLRGGELRAAWTELRWAARTLGPLNALMWALRTFNPPMLHAAYRAMRGDEWVYTGPLKHAAERPEKERDLPYQQDRLNSSLIRQIEGGLVDLLHYGDAISMAHSIESRVPFLDHRLAEFCLRLPGHLKYRHGLGKAVLREAVRNDVPQRIIDTRSKLGFPTPISQWFREHPETTVFPVLRSESCRSRGIFAPRALDAAIDKHLAGRADLSGSIYRWIVTELWFQEFIDGRGGDHESDAAASVRAAPSASLS